MVPAESPSLAPSPPHSLVERVIDWSARNPFLVIALTLVLVLAGWSSLRRVPLDAIPDLSDPQVIVLTAWEGRSPTLVEDQVTAPLVSRLMSTPRARVVRGFSHPGYSYIYVIFNEGTASDWARARVQEALASTRSRLPPGVEPELGPDASGVGWAFQYALVDRSGRLDAADLRSLQDWTLRPALQEVEGVAEIAAFGGFEKQYQVEIDPVRLEAFGLTPDAVVAAIRAANREAGAREIERNGAMWMVRGLGRIASLDDLRAVTVAPAGPGGAPVRLGEVAHNLAIGPGMRRGAGDLDGLGETAGGIVVVRAGGNVLDVLDRVKARLAELRPALPEGVEVITTHDRSDLIRGSVRTLGFTLAEEAVIVALVVLVFLLDFGGAARAVVTMPVAVLIAFIPLHLLGLSSNIMSLGGIAIALGAMVDEAVVMVENVHKRLEHAPPGLSPAGRRELVIAACRQLGKPLFFALLIITVSFLPVFALEAQEGRLFRPLALTKTLCMAAAALLSVTLGPALLVWMAGGRVIPERRHPVSRLLQRAYYPWVSALMRRRVLSIALALAAVASCVPAFKRLGSEFMPPLNEGDILYMPTTLPTLSIGEAVRVMTLMDRELKSFPEVLAVHGKAGRAETATDPAPLEMFETLVRLRPREEWRTVPRARWFSGWAPDPLRRALATVWPETRPLTWEELVREMDARLRIPGFVNAWTMPIRNRIDMLATGVRTPVGVRVTGPDIAAIAAAGALLEREIAAVPGTRSVFAERVATGLYLDIEPDRAALARLGLNPGDLLMALETAAGGMPVDTILLGRERYTVNVRYPRERRGDAEAIRRIRVPLMAAATGGDGMGAAPARPASVLLGEVARVSLNAGPAMIRNEDGGLTGWVYVDVDGRDLGGYVAEARRVVRERLEETGALAPGVRLAWSGQYEYLLRVRERLKLVVPLTLALIAFLLYVNFRSLPATLLILLSVPFSLTGGIWMVHWLGYHLSAAVWIGIIALAGLAAQTGIVMLVYLEEAYHAAVRAGRMRTQHDLFDAITLGAVRRVRPKVMTVLTMLLGLLPLLWSEGPGADVMKRIAAPMVGGLISSALLTLEIIPALYSIWRGRGVQWVKEKPPRRTWDELLRTAEPTQPT